MTCLNTFVMATAGLLSLPAFILTIYGGVTNYNLDYATLKNEGLGAFLKSFASCKSVVDYTFSSYSSAVQKQLLVACQAGVAPYYFFYSLAAIVVLFAAIAAIYSAYTKNKVQLFGSAMVVPIAFVMSWGALGVALIQNSLCVSRFMFCSGLGSADTSFLVAAGFYCLDGNTDLSEGKLYLRAVGCLIAGLALSMIMMSLLMYSTHSSYKNETESSGETNSPLLH